MAKILRYMGSLGIAMLFAVSIAWSGTYTAVRTGDWEADSTWGGTPAPTTIVNDSVVIPAGIEVRMGLDVTLDGLLAVLHVDGKLMAYDKTVATGWVQIDSGILSGQGEVTSHTIQIASEAEWKFTGTVLAQYFRCWTKSLQLKGWLRVVRVLNLGAGVFTVGDGSKLELFSGASIAIGNGVFAVDKGAFVTKSYGVSYASRTHSPGIELSGVGLNTVTVLSTLILDRDLTLNAIAIDGGKLMLNGYHFEVNIFTTNQYSPAHVVTTPTSSLTIRKKSIGSIRFQDEGLILNLTIGTAATDSIALTGNVLVRNILDVHGTLRLRNCSLTVGKTVRGEYLLSGDEYSTLTMGTSGSSVTSLAFAPNGQVLKNLNVHVGNGNLLKLNSPLEVVGDLNISSGDIDVRASSLTLRQSTIGEGGILVGDSTTLKVVGSKGLVRPLRLLGQRLGTFEIATEAGVRVPLGANQIVSKALRLVKGTLDLNGYDLTSAGDVFTNAGRIHSTAASNITVSGKKTTWVENGGWWSFEANGNEVGAYTVDHGSGSNIRGAIRIMKELRVEGGLGASRGFDDRYLPTDTLIVVGRIAGAGSISGSELAVILSGSSESRRVGAISVKSLDIGSTGRLIIDSSLYVGRVLELNNGILDVRNASAILGDTISGAGGIETNVNTALKLVLPHGLVQTLPFSADTVGKLTVEIDSASTLMLGRNLHVIGTLIYYRGALVLNAHDLAVHNSIRMSQRSRIVATSASNIYIGSPEHNPGEIYFASGGDTVNNFTINLTQRVSLFLGSNLSILGKLDLQKGRLFVSSDTLTMIDGATIIRASDSTYISTGWDGCLGLRVVPNSTSPTLFPVGTGYGYFPASISLHATPSSCMVYVGARRGVSTVGVQTGVASPVSEKTNFVWNITSDVIGALEFDLELGWQSSAERPTFDRDKAYISRLVDKQWDVSSAAVVKVLRDSLFFINRDGIDAFGQFAIMSSSITDIDDGWSTEGGLPSGPDKRPTLESLDAPRLYPSPCADFIIVDYPVIDNLPLRLEVVDVQGRVVLTDLLVEANYRVHIGGLCNGLYHIRLSGLGSAITSQFRKL